MKTALNLGMNTINCLLVGFILCLSACGKGRFSPEGQGQGSAIEFGVYLSELKASNGVPVTLQVYRGEGSLNAEVPGVKISGTYEHTRYNELQERSEKTIEVKTFGQVSGVRLSDTGLALTLRLNEKEARHLQQKEFDIQVIKKSHYARYCSTYRLRGQFSAEAMLYSDQVRCWPSEQIRGELQCTPMKPFGRNEREETIQNYKEMLASDKYECAKTFEGYTPPQTHVLKSVLQVLELDLTGLHPSFWNEAQGTNLTLEDLLRIKNSTAQVIPFEIKP